MAVSCDRRNIRHLSCVGAAKGMTTSAVLCKDRAPALCCCLVDSEGIGHGLQRKQEIGYTREAGLDDGFRSSSYGHSSRIVSFRNIVVVPVPVKIHSFAWFLVPDLREIDCPDGSVVRHVEYIDFCWIER